MKGDTKQQILDKLNNELDSLISKYQNALTEIKNNAQAQGKTVMELDSEISSKDADFSSLLAKLVKIYGEIQLIKNAK